VPLNHQVRALLDQMAEAGIDELSGTPAQRREQFRAVSLARRGPGYVPEAVADVSDARVHDIPVRIYTPSQDTGAVVVYLHGGGWVIGDIETIDPVCRRVANAVGATVVSVGYRLAPEHPYPAGQDDAMTVFRWALEHYPGRPVAVGGDSAGGQLAAGVAVRARDAGLPLAAQLLFYPATDPTASLPSMEENGEGLFLTKRDMLWFLEQYLPGGGGGIPEVDLLNTDVAGLAPAVVGTAEFDPLRDDGRTFAAHLATAGVPVDEFTGPGLIHGYAGMAGAIDDATSEVEAVLRAFRDRIAAPG
jgi:acetyl esterase